MNKISKLVGLSLSLSLLVINVSAFAAPEPQVDLEEPAPELQKTRRACGAQIICPGEGPFCWCVTKRDTTAPGSTPAPVPECPIAGMHIASCQPNPPASCDCTNVVPVGIPWGPDSVGSWTTCEVARELVMADCREECPGVAITSVKTDYDGSTGCCRASGECTEIVDPTPTKRPAVVSGLGGR